MCVPNRLEEAGPMGIGGGRSNTGSAPKCFLVRALTPVQSESNQK
jgi:hypothetical protein